MIRPGMTVTMAIRILPPWSQAAKPATILEPGRHG